MALGREIILVDEAGVTLYDDMIMNGSNDPVSPIVVKPGDQWPKREWPMADMPKCAFYMYAH